MGSYAHVILASVGFFPECNEGGSTCGDLGVRAAEEFLPAGVSPDHVWNVLLVDTGARGNTKAELGDNSHHNLQVEL